MSKNLIFLLLLLGLIVWSGTAYCDEEYTGRWYVAITGQLFTMDLVQRDHEIQGIMVPLNKNKKNVATISGTADGKVVDLHSSNKDLSIVYHFHGGLIGRGTTMALVGYVTRNNHHYNNWHATRYGYRVYYGSPDMNYSVFHNFDTPSNPF